VRVYQFRHIRGSKECSRTISALRRGLLICGLAGLAFASPAHAENVEVVVTLRQPALAEVFTQSRTLQFSSFARPNRLLLDAPASRAYLDRLARAQTIVARRIHAAVPRSDVRWHFGVTLNGFAVVVPRSSLEKLGQVPGVATVWPSVTYHTSLDRTPQLIGAPQLWGPTLATAGQGMKIGIVDDGIEQTHPFFAPAGYAFPAGYPKGQTAYTSPKVIVARAFAPAGTTYANAKLPYDTELSDHGSHVAGIAAGNYNTGTRLGFRLSGIAPRAYLGNYKALGMPSQFGANGNSPELAAAIEAAVRDGMDVINLSLGETEIEPTRDIVTKALNAAAAAGVVSSVSAGNDFDELGLGTITSPANAAKTIAVAASSGGHGSPDADVIADFSSAGPTPYSLLFKPDVTAPGEDVASAGPGGSFVENSGTSMSAPHVAGAAAVLRQRHPEWTPAQIKSALVTTGDPVRNQHGTEVGPLREGGGRIDLPKADQPLFFTSPTSLTFGLLRPGKREARRLTLTDAGGGVGAWSAAVTGGGRFVSVSRQVSVPGTVIVRVAVPRDARQGDVDGFIVLSHGSARRRIPFWLRIERPRLRLERHTTLTRSAIYRANTSRGVARVSTYRYPDVPAGHSAFPVRLTGRELVYRVFVRRPIANFGIAIVALDRGVGVEPRIVRAGDENRLAGYTALPFDQNPYRTTYGQHRLVAGVVLPGRGAYDIVFDTPPRGHPGGFRFRFWMNDAAPPSVHVIGVRGGALELALTDRGSGVDPTSLSARIDGDVSGVSYGGGRVRISLFEIAPGRHTLTFTAADYQETKNMENVPRILPNTRTIRTTFTR
jgi:subtilisin family serine protease